MFTAWAGRNFIPRKTRSSWPLISWEFSVLRIYFNKYSVVSLSKKRCGNVSGSRGYQLLVWMSRFLLRNLFPFTSEAENCRNTANCRIQINSKFKSFNQNTTSKQVSFIVYNNMVDITIISERLNNLRILYSTQGNKFRFLSLASST